MKVIIGLLQELALSAWTKHKKKATTVVAPKVTQVKNQIVFCKELTIKTLWFDANKFGNWAFLTRRNDCCPSIMARISGPK